MGFFRILKANLSSIKKQREIESAMSLGHSEKATKLIGKSMNEILKAGLTKKELAILEIIKEEHRETLNKLLSEAFQRGWTGGGEPNLSNAMDEVLRSAQEAVREYKSMMT